MGRAKLNLDLIAKEKNRSVTFKKRKEGLIRKMHEFTTLCDVSACVIIYGPKQEKGFSEPEIWPQSLDEVRRIIDIYKAKGKDSGNKTFTLLDFFNERKRKIEDELAKLKKRNMETKYPTWLDFLNFMPEAHLRELAATLSNKAEYVKSRIEFLRRNKESGLDINLMDFAHARLSQSHHSTFYSPSGLRGIEMEVINQQAISSVKPIDHMHVPIHYPTIDHHQELHSHVNQNSMMMFLMNDNDHCLQFGGASSSGNIQCAAASFKRQVFYESSGGRGVVDPMICHSPRNLARYYAPPVLGGAPPVPPPYMQCAMMPGLGGPQLQFTTREFHDGGQEDYTNNIVQYEMKNERARFFD